MKKGRLGVNINTQNRPYKSGYTRVVFVMVNKRRTVGRWRFLSRPSFCCFVLVKLSRRCRTTLLNGHRAAATLGLAARVASARRGIVKLGTTPEPHPAAQRSVASVKAMHAPLSLVLVCILRTFDLKLGRPVEVRKLQGRVEQLQRRVPLV